MALGRPSLYSVELADRICERLAGGESLLSICSDPSFPHESTVRAWALDDREGFYTKYARAREIQAETMADEIHSLSDQVFTMIQEADDPKLANALVQAQKLRVDTRRWLMSKTLPKKYGDRTTLAGDPNAPLGVQLIHSVPQPDRGEE